MSIRTHKSYFCSAVKNRFGLRGVVVIDDGLLHQGQQPCQMRSETNRDLSREVRCNTMATMFLVAGCSGNGSPPNMAPPPITADETATTITTTTAPSATTTPPTTAAPATTQAPPTSTQPLVIALTDPAAIRTRSEEIARDTIGRRLNPAEQQRLVDAIHEVERESAQAAATGSEYIDVDVDAQITEYIKRTYPEETSAAQMQDAWWTMMELMCAEDPNYAPPGEPSPCPLLEIMNNEGD